MTNDEIRRKISKLKHISASNEDFVIMDILEKSWMSYFPSGELKDWPESIADVWALEEEIPVDQRTDYVQYLDEIVHENFKPYPSKFDLAHASPRCRSLAWIAWKGAQG